MAWSSQGRRARLSALIVGAILMGAARPTNASPAERDHLLYDAPAECPSKDELVRAIEARTTASQEDDPRTFRATIERGPHGDYVGRLQVVGAAAVPRVTRAVDCAAVVKTLAVFVVIARTPEEPSGSPSPPPPSAAPAPKPEAPRRPRVALPPVSQAKPRIRTSAAVRVSLATASSSEVTTGVRVQDELSWRPAKLPVSPLVRLSYGTASFDTPVEPGSASFRFRTGRLEACTDIDLGLHLGLVPCVGGELGDLVATTRDRPIDVRTTTRWAAMTAGGGVRWSAVPWLSFGVDLVAVIPFTRKQFAVVDPVRRVYTAPPAFLEMGALAAVNADF